MKSTGAVALKATCTEDCNSGPERRGPDNAVTLNKPGAAIGLCVRSIKFCPGTTFCKQAKQDAVGLGLKLDEKYHGMSMPSKLKIGVSGCPNSCAEPAIKDIGLMGTAKGYNLMVGGSAAAVPRLAQVVAKDLPTMP